MLQLYMDPKKAAISAETDQKEDQMPTIVHNANESQSYNTSQPILDDRPNSHWIWVASDGPSDCSNTELTNISYNDAKMHTSSRKDQYTFRRHLIGNSNSANHTYAARRISPACELQEPAWAPKTEHLAEEDILKERPCRRCGPFFLNGQDLNNHGRCDADNHEPKYSRSPVIESGRDKPQCWDHGCNGRGFANFSNLLRHQREKSGTVSKSYCPHCGAVFTRATARNGHVESGKCKIRSKATNMRQSLMHPEVHNDVIFAPLIEKQDKDVVPCLRTHEPLEPLKQPAALGYSSHLQVCEATSIKRSVDKDAGNGPTAFSSQFEASKPSLRNELLNPPSRLVTAPVEVLYKSGNEISNSGFIDYMRNVHRCRSNLESSSPSASETSTISHPEELDIPTRKFVEEVAANIVDRFLRLSKPCIQSRPEHESQSSTSRSNPSNASRTPAMSSPSFSKRQRPSIHPNDNDNSEDEDRHDHKTKKRKRTAPRYVKLWACPYHKFDPLRYSEHNQSEKSYRKCGSVTLTHISSLKQHLRRTHKEPSFYCGNCYEQFCKKSDLIQHNKISCVPGPNRYLEMITDEQYESIPKYLSNTAESWYEIFGKIFENASRPASPYISTCDQATLQSFVDLYRWIGPQEFLNVIRLRQEREPHSLLVNVSLRMLIETTFETAFPEYLQQLRNVVEATSLQGAPGNDTSTAGSEIDSMIYDKKDEQDYTNGSFITEGQVDPQVWLSNPDLISDAFTEFDSDLFRDSSLLDSFFD